VAPVARNRIMATFGTTDRANAARMALLAAGYRPDDVVVSFDITADSVGAENPGQGFENHPLGGTSGMSDRIPPATPDADHIAARLMSDVHRSGAVLTLATGTVELGRALGMLWQHDPTIVRRLGRLA